MALLYLANYILSFLGNSISYSFTKNLTFDKLFGIFFTLVSGLLGVDTKDIFIAGQLIGQKTFLTSLEHMSTGHKYMFLIQMLFLLIELL